MASQEGAKFIYIYFFSIHLFSPCVQMTWKILKEMGQYRKWEKNISSRQSAVSGQETTLFLRVV